MVMSLLGRFVLVVASIMLVLFVFSSCWLVVRLLWVAALCLVMVSCLVDWLLFWF